MNKKLNKVLNIIEVSLVLLIAITMIVLSKISISGLNNDLLILRRILLFTSVISEIIIIGIELLLFSVYKKNVKYLYIAYLIGEISLAVLVNIYIPFSGLIVIGTFSFTKSIIRLTKLVDIYNKRLFNRYCKLFNIKLTTETKRRKTTRRKTARKKVTTTSSKQVKSYA